MAGRSPTSRFTGRVLQQAAVLVSLRSESFAVLGERPRSVHRTKSNRVFIVVVASVAVVVVAFISRIYLLQLWEIVFIVIVDIVIVVVVVLPSSSSPSLPAGSRRSVGCWLAGWLVYFYLFRRRTISIFLRTFFPLRGLSFPYSSNKTLFLRNKFSVLFLVK